MLVCPNELVAGMETPIEMGTHHPRVPAATLLLQHSQQSHLVAVVVVIGIPDAICFGSKLRFLVHPLPYGGKPATSSCPLTIATRPVFAASAERPVAGSDMGACLCRQPD